MNKCISTTPRSQMMVQYDAPSNSWLWDKVCHDNKTCGMGCVGWEGAFLLHDYVPREL